MTTLSRIRETLAVGGEAMKDARCWAELSEFEKRVFMTQQELTFIERQWLRVYWMWLALKFWFLRWLQ